MRGLQQMEATSMYKDVQFFFTDLVALWEKKLKKEVNVKCEWSLMLLTYSIVALLNV